MSMHQVNIKMANEALSRVGRGSAPKSLRALRVMWYVVYNIRINSYLSHDFEPTQI